MGQILMRPTCTSIPFWGKKQLPTLTVFSGFFIVRPFRALLETHATVEDKVVDAARSAVVRVWPVAILAVCMAGKAVLVFSVELRRAVLHTLPLMQDELIHALYRGQQTTGKQGGSEF